MPAGNKKKKRKPAENPARGFATTSTPSKSVDHIKDGVSADNSSVATPEGVSTPAGDEKTTPHLQASERELNELSPEELEARFENAELQRFVENWSWKVKKDASRQSSRLRSERRIGRSQAEYLSTKPWLPEELMQEILNLLDSLREQDRSSKKQSLHTGDDLLAKIWRLRLVLLDLGVSLDRTKEVITHVLEQPPAEDSTAQTWGLGEAFDWLALHCTSDELLDYDTQKKHVAKEAYDDFDNVSGDESEDTTERIPGKRSRPLLQAHMTSDLQSENDDLNVSDIASDTEPDELLSIYLRTKASLYEIDPAAEEILAKKKNKKPHHTAPASTGADLNYVTKILNKLRNIECDPLFDAKQAEAEWAVRKNSLAQEAAQRRRLALPHEKLLPSNSPSRSSTLARDADYEQSAERREDTDLNGVGSLEEDNLLGGVFDYVPGLSHQDAEDTVHDDKEQSAKYGDGVVALRDFKDTRTGMSPRRVLEEACRSRDSGCKIEYKQVSPTTYSCRHSILIIWTREQEMPEHAFMSSVAVKTKPSQLTVTMIKEATPNSGQSESYVATTALFLIFSASPKEQNSHLRLPPSYRDLWGEFMNQKRQYIDAADRATVKELRSMIESQIATEDNQDDEVVFNINSRRLNGNGNSTPTTRPSTPGIEKPDMSQALKDIWTSKSSSRSYQHMLISRRKLPMFNRKATVLETIENNQVTIIVGDTGSGKSTQVPQFLLENELTNGRQCKIYCTEPRRISAISLAQRVSQELGESKNELGTSRSLVGYAIRMESKTTMSTRLVYATVGIVLRMLEKGMEGLDEVTHLILDEVHERSIDTDFLLIVLRSLMIKRPDLKVVLMSATVDAQKFANYLQGAPIITVSGRTFPVQAMFLEDVIELTGYSSSEPVADMDHEDVEEDSDVQSHPESLQSLASYSLATRKALASFNEYQIDYALIIKLLEVVAHHQDYERFSEAILIFCPGILEIRQIDSMLAGHSSFSRGWRIYPLHSSFSTEDQQAAFETPPDGIRKIVIATNIAETGITIPDVTCVIDAGKHREMRFDERRQMSRLTQSFIAKSNAKQRRGRAGRVQEGICFHLFTRYRYEKLMAEQQTPEMLRLSLQDLVMRVKICKLGAIEDTLSQALDPPSSKNIRRAIDALIEVGALSENEHLTALGSQLAELPLDAQLGKLVLYGDCFGCLDFALTVAATLTSKTPFLSPLYAKNQADSVRLGFKRGDSDLLTLFNAYRSWRNVCSTRGISEYQFCNKNFLSPQNLANIEDLKRQLAISLVDAGFVTFPDANAKATLTGKNPGRGQRNFVSLPERYCSNDDNEAITSSIVAWSFYPKIVKRDGKGWRNVANNQSLALHPLSINKGNVSPDIKYLSFYSIMQSSSRFANAQETTPVSDFALVLLAGEAVFQMYSGVIVIDGNKLRFKVKDWKTMIVLKTLRAKVKEGLSRQLQYPGRELGDRQRRWMELIDKIFEHRNA